MGYKPKTYNNKSPEAPYFLLEKGIYKNLNVASLGYVISREDDSRFLNKTVRPYKYKVKLGPIDESGGKNLADNTIYGVTCLEGVDITEEEINTGRCAVLILFLDNYPGNFYKNVGDAYKPLDYKLGDTSGAEDIYHDCRNGIIIGKLKLTK